MVEEAQTKERSWIRKGIDTAAYAALSKGLATS
jgi:hypothetical protein